MSLPPITGAEQYVDADGRLTWDGQKVFRQMRDLIVAIEAAGMTVSQFGEQKTVSRFPVLTLNSSYGLSSLRDVQTTSGSGAISAASTGEILLSTGATATSQALIESARRGVYIPGFGAEIGVGVRIPTAPTGNQYARWGGWDVTPENGFYWGYDASGLYVAYLSGGTETKIRQSAFNVDKLDGSGPLGFNLDITNGNIFQINFTWYGYGVIEFSVVTTIGTEQKKVTAHSVRIEGSTSVRNPNLAVFCEANNGGDATDLDVYMGGRQYSVVGDYRPNRRYTGAARDGVSTSTTIEPLVTFRKKSGFLDRAVLVDGFEADVSTQPVQIEVRLNGSLTGASYVTPPNHTASETALEADVSATAITGGEVIYTFFLGTGAGNQGVANESTLQIAIPDDQPVTLCARTLSGTGSISANFRMVEEW